MEKIFFKSDYHETLYSQFISKLNSDDMYYKGFAYVASAIEKKEILDVLSDHEVNSEMLMEMSSVWSGSERALVEVAFQIFSNNNLYDEDEEIKFQTLHSLFRLLNSENVAIVIEAISMKYL